MVTKRAGLSTACLALLPVACTQVVPDGSASAGTGPTGIASGAGMGAILGTNGGAETGVIASGGIGGGASGTAGSGNLMNTTAGMGGTTALGGANASGGSAGSGAGGADGVNAGAGGMSAGAGGAIAAGNGAGGEATFGPEVTVQLGIRKQEMAGFGINNNWSDAMTDDVADTLFGTGEGQLGLTILRIGMNPQGNAYNGDDCWSDMEKASALGVEYFIGTLWSPPGDMKSNGSITGGGHLLPEYYEEWSDTIAAFPGVVKQNTGIDLYAMSPQNETDFASCGLSEPCNGNYDTTLFTGQEYADFAAVVGPKLHALDPPVKMMSPEASEWIHVWSNESGCCTEPGGVGSSDPLDCGFPATNCTDWTDGYMYGYALYNHPTAWQYVDLLGTHQYDTQVGEPWPSDVPDRKPVWQTEMSGVKWWPEQGPSTHIENGVAVAGSIHSALTVGEASAWLWWWYRALGDTNEGLLLSDGTVAKRMWTLGQYSRFIRPGYTRVEITGEIPTGILLTAFSGPDGTVVVVAVNQGTAAMAVPITIAGGAIPTSLSTWVTSESDDMAPQDEVLVMGGTFTASLPGTTVTTFVGQ